MSMSRASNWQSLVFFAALGQRQNQCNYPANKSPSQQRVQQEYCKFVIGVSGKWNYSGYKI